MISCAVWLESFKKWKLWYASGVFLELQGLELELSLGVGLDASKLLIADSRYVIHGNRVPVAGTGYVHDLKVWIPTPAPPSAKKAEYWCTSIIIWRCSFFQDKCGRYHCILAHNFVLYITCSYVLENDYILKSFVASKWNISNTTSKCTVLIYIHKFFCILTLP